MNPDPDLLAAGHVRCAVAGPVMTHRLILNYKSRLDQVTAFGVVRDLLKRLDATGLDLPGDIAIMEKANA